MQKKFTAPFWVLFGVGILPILSLFIEEFVFILLPRKVNVNISLQQFRSGNLIQTVVFGLLVIYAHVFLFRVLRQISAKRKNGVPESVNLLDDVLS